MDSTRLPPRLPDSPPGGGDRYNPGDGTDARSPSKGACYSGLSSWTACWTVHAGPRRKHARRACSQRTGIGKNGRQLARVATVCGERQSRTGDRTHPQRR
eukprot:16066199-Heterocapsa_arctica.AAC.1